MSATRSVNTKCEDSWTLWTETWSSVLVSVWATPWCKQAQSSLTRLWIQSAVTTNIWKWFSFHKHNAALGHRQINLTVCRESDWSSVPVESSPAGKNVTFLNRVWCKAAEPLARARHDSAVTNFNCLTGDMKSHTKLYCSSNISHANMLTVLAVCSISGLLKSSETKAQKLRLPAEHWINTETSFN